ncbi:STELLO glycosyltransferase family protein [Rhodopseudomonas sp. BR0M22]|uniref:STELLO glycosyltransferase family protein n=1 Tax=Rhodopseudomonas sp. BR0M22 TaxID=2269369 RepID=UPI001966FB09|nr:STELLO glycosyltransferase family protein [Rhodopseudomonas sp. BR0M22]
MIGQAAPPALELRPAAQSDRAPEAQFDLMSAGLFARNGASKLNLSGPGSMKQAIIVTSINAPNPVMKAIAKDANPAGFDFIVVGDTKSPSGFSIDGCSFLSIADQLASGLKYAEMAPTACYARKNVGYLTAISRGAEMITETDDDNYPRPQYFAERSRKLRARAMSNAGWVNAYSYFSDSNIWPRGLPLDQILKPVPPWESLELSDIDSPIQQGLADENPDVDAVYRLILPLPQNFRTDRVVAFGPGSWCPFNSQNTSWWPDAFPLMYLPAYCNFRVTDIWRSMIAQRIAWENGWHILFHGPTVWQDRNEHDLMKDFEDEIPGYLHNHRIRTMLENLPISGGLDNLVHDLHRCYEALVTAGLVGAQEIPLLEAWIADIDRVRKAK